ncbi:nickel pincer cofactor biosynthesis protein LarC [Candidatus Magnetominusculus dajiuhuensis]|uniref:nickel pincer cofactor biosynthesis protein LarC n=1 Tax=Candidatus Magnetominusculus dajiuhuensis TaxID=3137712 RepID=UPI003B434E7C
MEDTKVAYIQCASGVSGDMLVGAVIDAGVPLEYLRERLSVVLKQKDGGEITSKTVYKNGFRALKFDVNPSVSHQHNGHRNWKDIVEIIDAAGFDDDIKAKGLKIFRSIFEAEAIAHGQPFEHTHLHELGAVDCLADVFGFLSGIKYLGIEKICVSPINVGGGSVKTVHGTLPVPAPATAYLLRGMPVYSSGVEFELTTPTGAAIIKEMSADFGAFPDMIVDTIGTGAGGRDIASAPNILRIFIGRAGRQTSSDENAFIIETNIDDMSPQLYGGVMEKLFRAGALDVYITPVIMKKCRPAALLTVITGEDKIEPLSQIIFEETTTIGLRYYRVSRETLQRTIHPVNTKYGEIRIKTAVRNGKCLNVSAEYEDCKKAAAEFSVPVRRVIEEALRQANDS